MKLSSLAKLCPDLFVKAVTPANDTAISLPIQKLVEQIGEFYLRPDQELDETPANTFETPFLTEAIRDAGPASTKPPAPIAPHPEPVSAPAKPAAPAPPKPPEPAPAKPVEAAPPVEQKSITGAGSVVSIPPAQPAGAKARPPIPFTGLTPATKKPEPAPEQIAPVAPPTPLPQPPRPVEQAPPPPLPPAPPAPPAPTPLTPPPVEVPESAPTSDLVAPIPQGKGITLNLSAILRALPIEYIQGNLETVDKNKEVTLPADFILPQLANGRVALAVQVFCKYLSPDDRRMFAHADPEGLVPLPLPLVLASIPPEAIAIRPDQQQETPIAEIPTPFSQKAKEDAQKGLTGGVAEPPAPAPVQTQIPLIPEPVMPPPPAAPLPPPLAPAVAAAAPIAPEESHLSALAPTPTAAPEPKFESLEPTREYQFALQEIFLTEEVLDARTVVTLASRFPGVAGCILSTSDGLNLVGSKGKSTELDTLSQIAPTFFKRIGGYANDIALGKVMSVTLQCEKGIVSMFLVGEICLSVMHDHRDFVPGMRDRFLKIAKALAGMYSDTEKKK